MAAPRSLKRLAVSCSLASLWFACGPTQEDERLRRLSFYENKDALTVCPGPVTVPGIDVSFWQGHINWPQVATAGYAFAIARINDGHSMDGEFNANWAGIKSIGLIRGAYQFYEPSLSAEWQANVVINAVGRLGAGDLPVTLDVEWPSSPGTPTAGAIRDWVNRVEAGTGKRPIIYTASGYWNSYLGGQFADLDLWVANYGVSCPGLPNGWSSWKMWQWGGKGVPGISGSVDHNVWNGSLDDLRKYADGATNENCASSQAAGCGNFGCYCADNACSGGFCPGNGCTAQHTSNCAVFGCQCVDGQCSGGFCPGGGCTAKEVSDCGKFGCDCVDHKCDGVACAGSGCTAKEMSDCGKFGCNCVSHKCSGGYCPGSGCTLKEATDCQKFGCGCVDHQCAGGACANSGCTALQVTNCGKFGCGCADGACAGGACPKSGCTSQQASACQAKGCGCADGKCSGGSCAGSGCTLRQALDCQAADAGCALGVCSAIDGGQFVIDAGEPDFDAGFNEGPDFDAGEPLDAGPPPRGGAPDGSVAEITGIGRDSGVNGGCGCQSSSEASWCVGLLALLAWRRRASGAVPRHHVG